MIVTKPRTDDDDEKDDDDTNDMINKRRRRQAMVSELEVVFNLPQHFFEREQVGGSNVTRAESSLGANLTSEHPIHPPSTHHISTSPRGSTPWSPTPPR